MEHDTSDEDSLMSDKDVEEESWTFMENPVYEENDEPETFDGFVDSPIYGIFEGERMDLVALGNFSIEKEHAVYPYDLSEPYISINNEDKENLISKLDINNGESITFDIDGSDDYWNFCEYIIKNPIYSISSKGSV